MNSKYLISFLALIKRETEIKHGLKRMHCSQYSNNTNFFNNIDSQKRFTQIFSAHVQEQIAAEEKGEEQFVLFKERATDIAV